MKYVIYAGIAVLVVWALFYLIRHIDVYKRQRQLRNIVCGLGGKVNGVPREDGFDITVASEIMAVLCLASDLMDLKTRLGLSLIHI